MLGKKRFLAQAFATAMLGTLGFAPYVQGAPCSFGPGGGAGLQGVLDSFTVAPVLGVSSTNVTSDCLDPQTFAVSGAGGAFSTIVVAMAGAMEADTFGIYDVTDITNTVPLFRGTDGAGGSKVLSIFSDGTVLVNNVVSGVVAGNNFGFYLDSSRGVGDDVWFSETLRNRDGADHMLAYGSNGDIIQIPPFAAGPFFADQLILAWEDEDLVSSDLDYTDFVVAVSGIAPQVVPEPNLLSLLGAGLLLMGGARPAQTEHPSG